MEVANNDDDLILVGPQFFGQTYRPNSENYRNTEKRIIEAKQINRQLKVYAYKNGKCKAERINI